MTTIQHSPSALRRTVSMVCGLLNEQQRTVDVAPLAELELRIELVSCLLGSQVRAESANAAVERLNRAGLLTNRQWVAMNGSFETEAHDALAAKDSQLPSYRFPALRARQLAMLRSQLQGRSLCDYLNESNDARKIRRLLVRELPGIGPKQASMFLRNVGASYDLAILDVHVLRFLRLVGVLPCETVPVSALAAYERVEVAVRRYADSLGRAVGHLDWAIWITMRAAAEVQA